MGALGKGHPIETFDLLLRFGYGIRGNSKWVRLLCAAQNENS
jgi:hypothetical protein